MNKQMTGSGLIHNLVMSISTMVLKTVSLLLYIVAELFNVLERISYSELLKLSPVVTVFKNVGERNTAKYYGAVTLLTVVFFEKLVNMWFDPSRHEAFFSICSTVLSFLVQL